MKKFLLFLITALLLLSRPGWSSEPLKLKWSRLLTFEKICKPGKLIVASSTGNPQYLVDMSNGEIIYQTDPNTEVGLRTNYFGDKYYFYIINDLSSVQCYDVKTKEFLGKVISTPESSDNSEAVFFEKNNTFVIWNGVTNLTTDSVKIPNTPEIQIFNKWSWEYSLDSRYFAISLIQGLTPYFYLYDRNTKEFLFQGKKDFKYCFFNKSNKMAYAENMKLAGDDTIYSYIRIYDPDQRTVIQDIKISKVNINHLTIRSDDNYIIYEIDDGINYSNFFSLKDNKISDYKVGLPTIIYADENMLYCHGGYLYGYNFDWTVGVNDNPVKDDSTIYPNPSTNKITVNIPEQYFSGIWQITDFTGKIIIKGIILPQNKLQIDVSKLIPQTYFLTIKKDNLAKTYKLVKQ